MIAWTFDPLVVPALVITAALYARGVAVLGGRVPRWRIACFVAGWLTLVFSLLSPLKALSDALFSAHMTQHELLMLVAAPLIALGRPLVPFVWAFPPRPRGRLVSALRAWPVLLGWRALTHPLVILIVHGAAIWVWHLPFLFEAAMSNETVHALQHLCFFGTATLFFYSLLYGRYGRVGYGVAVAYVFVTALHSALLGAFLTFAQRLWYPLYAARSSDAFEDQQLAGLIMWVPAGVLLMCIGLALFAAWLGISEKRVALSRVEALTRGSRP